MWNCQGSSKDLQVLKTKGFLVMNVILNHWKLFAILSLTPLGTWSGSPGCYIIVLKWLQCYFLREGTYSEAWSHWETYKDEGVSLQLEVDILLNCSSSFCMIYNSHENNYINWDCIYSFFLIWSLLCLFWLRKMEFSTHT